jgi:hypothetical protein
MLIEFQANQVADSIARFVNSPNSSLDGAELV